MCDQSGVHVEVNPFVPKGDFGQTLLIISFIHKVIFLRSLIVGGWLLSGLWCLAAELCGQEVARGSG